MKTKTIKSAAGLRLWEASIEFRGDFGIRKSASLWITTAGGNIAKASTKTQTFLHRKRHDYRQAKITKIDDRGTVDA